MGVMLQLQQDEHNIYNIYKLPDRTDLDMSDLLAACATGGGILIKGDFNAYHEVIWARRNKWTSYFRSDGESA